MIRKICSKLFRLFFAFMFIITAIGIVALLINDIKTPDVYTTSIYKTGMIVYDLSVQGDIISSEHNEEFEVKASESIHIKNVKMHANEYCDDNDILFSIDSSRLDEQKLKQNKLLSEQIEEIDLGISDKLTSLSKVLGRDIADIRDVNENDNIVIKAAASGNINNLSIGVGERILDMCIGCIADTDDLSISFRMTPAEYGNMSIGQNVLLSFTGYDGFYQGTITYINSEHTSNSDNSSFVYEGKIEIKNPGLIVAGTDVGVYTQMNGKPDKIFFYAGVVDRLNTIDIESSMCSNNSMNVYVQKLYFKDGDHVEKGQIIAEAGGDDLRFYLSESINSIKTDIADKNKLLKTIEKTYDNFIEGSGITNCIVDEKGYCFITANNILISYISDDGNVYKGDTLLKYYIVDNDNTYIRVRVPNSIYRNNVQRNISNMNWRKNEHDSIPMKYLYAKSFLDYFDIYYSIPKNDQLSIGDKINVEIRDSEEYRYVLPKTAIETENGIKPGAKCYVYPIKEMNSYLGKVNMVTGKIEAYIVDYDDRNVAIQFLRYSEAVKIKKVVDFVRTSYKKGDIVNIIEQKSN